MRTGVEMCVGSIRRRMFEGGGGVGDADGFAMVCGQLSSEVLEMVIVMWRV